MTVQRRFQRLNGAWDGERWPSIQAVRQSKGVWHVSAAALRSQGVQCPRVVRCRKRGRDTRVGCRTGSHGVAVCAALHGKGAAQQLDTPGGAERNRPRAKAAVAPARRRLAQERGGNAPEDSNSQQQRVEHGTPACVRGAKRLAASRKIGVAGIQPACCVELRHGFEELHKDSLCHALGHRESARALVTSTCYRLRGTRGSGG